MKPITLMLAIFFISFSHNVMAAQAQLKTNTAPVQEDSAACIAAYDNCLTTYKSVVQDKHTGNSNKCITSCEAAKPLCIPKSSKAESEKGKPESHFSQVGRMSLHCKNIINQNKVKK